jgi:hypothetical protein
VSVSAATTHVLAGTPVTFTLGTQSASAPVGQNGTATATFALNQAPVVTTLRATVAGLSTSAPFTIDKDSTHLTAAVVAKTLQAVLTAAGSNSPIAGRTVTFFVNGKKVGTANTTSTGTATLKHTAPVGAVIRTTFAGDTFFLASSSS